MFLFVFGFFYACGPSYDCAAADVICADEKGSRDTDDAEGQPEAVPEPELEPDPEPSIESCHERVVDWPAEWVLFEEQVLEEVNIRRSQPADCGSEGLFEPTTPLTMDPEIQCAARYHSIWMSENQYTHDSPGGDLGDDPQARLQSVGYSGAWGENIYASPASAAAAVEGWMASDGHCSNIMSDWWTVIGIGYYRNPSSEWEHYWTQNFGDR